MIVIDSGGLLMKILHAIKTRQAGVTPKLDASPLKAVGNCSIGSAKGSHFCFRFGTTNFRRRRG